MPVIHVSIAKKLTEEEKASLADKIARAVSQVPGKPYDRAMVRIDDACAIYRAGAPVQCAFLETRFFQKSEKEELVKYTENLFRIFDELLGIDKTQLYTTILEHDYWGSKGTLK